MLRYLKLNLIKIRPFFIELELVGDIIPNYCLYLGLKQSKLQEAFQYDKQFVYPSAENHCLAIKPLPKLNHL